MVDQAPLIDAEDKTCALEAASHAMDVKSAQTAGHVLAALRPTGMVETPSAHTDRPQLPDAIGRQSSGLR